ncbi:MAG: response regulator transcription factor [Myxococcales bacterium]|nr:response regulator transcription factor [Myxococcales bacterium]
MTSTSSQTIRILLAEDHTIVRQGLFALLSQAPDLLVVAEASDGNEAVRLALEHQPDVIVMDIGLPYLNGVDATAQIRQQLPQTQVLILSMHSGEEYVRPAIRAGARGFLLKGSDLSELVLAIRAVVEGNAFFCPTVANLLLQDSFANKPTTHHPQLTAREREVLQKVAEGFSSTQIAHLLEISSKTVESHRARIMQKLHIHDIPGLVRYAIRIGLIAP